MFVTLINTPITLDPNQLATDQGWSISESVAYHSGCFAGIIVLKNIEVTDNTTYIINYEVKERTSGGVYPIVGGVSGTNRTTVGKYSDTIVVPNGATDLSIKFYSDGELSVSYMDIYPVLDNPENGHTLGFNADNNRWTTYYSYYPEMMLKFVNDFFTFNNGTLWKHNSNEVRNNFYGEQGVSQLTLIVNLSPTTVKNYFSIREKSNNVWWCPTITTPPVKGKGNGQSSKLKSGRFKSLNGDWFADFLRDQTDPRFATDALFKGALLQGSYMTITFQCDSTDEVQLLSIDVTTSPQNYTY